MKPDQQNNSTFYNYYESADGKIFSLYWENAGNLSFKLKQEIKQLFIDSFLAQYRTVGITPHLTDSQIKTDLKGYFIKSVEPRFINNSKQYLLCASINKKVLGFIFWEDLGKNQVYIAELAIACQYWRHGLGKLLIGSIFNKKPNTQKIVVLTEIKNYGAINFYVAMGYKPSTYTRKGYSSKDFCSYEKLFLTK